MITGNVTSAPTPRLGGPGVTAYSSMTLLPNRIEHQARLRPHDIAVECGERQITYAELNAIAGRLAQRLRSCGVGPGDVVAVLAERSALLPAALFGAWKAGA